jgi:hypothetical protein
VEAGDGRPFPIVQDSTSIYQDVAFPAEHAS